MFGTQKFGSQNKQSTSYTVPGTLCVYPKKLLKEMSDKQRKRIRILLSLMACFSHRFRPQFSTPNSKTGEGETFSCVGTLGNQLVFYDKAHVLRHNDIKNHHVILILMFSRLSSTLFERTYISFGDGYV